LKNKVALITGGAQGLGKAIALAMAREGANIVICDINASTLPVAQAEVKASGEPTLRATVTIWSARPSARTGHDRMTLER
jgi:NAD(P)-dependent dehydrogenase (short-subunit alcohol dehydrogenase family)